MVSTYCVVKTLWICDGGYIPTTDDKLLPNVS